MKIIIYTFPYRGHITWISQIVNVLSRCEHQVIVDTSLDLFYFFDDKVTKQKCLYNFRDRTNDSDKRFYLGDYIEGVLLTSREYINRLTKMDSYPDLIIFDSMAYWGKCISTRLNIPSISYITNQPFNNDSMKTDNYGLFSTYRDLCSSEHKFLREMHLCQTISIGKYNLSTDFKWTDIFCSFGNYNFILTIEQMCKYKMKQDNMFYYLPTIETKYERIRDGVYISLGSMIENANLLERIIEAILPLNIKIFVNGGKHANTLKAKYPCIVSYNFAPQIEILAKCQVFITHGGMNSIREALITETPMLVIPMVNDQFVNAEMVEKNVFGLKINVTDSTFENELSTCLNQIISNNKFSLSIRKAVEFSHKDSYLKIEQILSSVDINL